METESPLSHKFSWAVVEQALFAGTNFALNLVLARLLGPAGYGVFSAVFSVGLLGVVVQQALVIEPMMVFGRSQERGGRYAFAYTVGRINLLLAAGCSGAVLVVALVLSLVQAQQVAIAAVGLALYVPVLFLLWFGRRQFYLFGEVRASALFGVCYAVVGVAAAGAAALRGHISPFGAFVLLAIPTVVTSVPLLLIFRMRHQSPTAAPKAVSVVARLWSYGRWSLSSAVLSWVPINLFMILIPIVAGAAVNGVVSATLNLYQPAMQTFAALSGVIIAEVAGRKAAGGEMTPLLRKLAVAGVVGGGLYGVGMAIVGPLLMVTIYGVQYVVPPASMWLLVGLPVAAGVTCVYGAFLRGSNRPDLVLQSFIGGAFGALLGAGVLVATRNLLGAVIAILCSYGMTAVLLWMKARGVAAELAVGGAASAVR
jgi:O-antigen/teichoic acid export membrane protein